MINDYFFELPILSTNIVLQYFTMMKLKNTLALFSLLVFAFAVRAEEPTKESLQAFIESVYEQQINNLSFDDPGELEEVMKNFDKSFTGTRALVTIDGNTEVITLNQRTMRERYSRTSRLPGGLNVHYSISDYNTLEVRGDIGIANYTVEYSNMVGGEKIQSGRILIQLAARHFNNGTWKIIFINQFEVESTRFIGTCQTSIFSNGNGYVAQTLIPDGEQSREEFNRFEVKQNGNHKVVKIDGNSIYNWNTSTGLITSQSGDQVGAAQTDNTALQLIIKYVYQPNCSTIRQRATE